MEKETSNGQETKDGNPRAGNASDRKDGSDEEHAVRKTLSYTWTRTRERERKRERERERERGRKREKERERERAGGREKERTGEQRDSREIPMAKWLSYLNGRAAASRRSGTL